MKNHKPAVVFDEKYNTNISQEYKFPFNLSADEVWDILPHKNDFGNRFSYRLGVGDDWKLKVIVDNIDFPYIDFKKLTDWEKTEVLQGMCSGINSDDIIWYIQGNYACVPKSIEVEKELVSMGLSLIHWVISPKTLERIKEQLLTYG